MPARSWLHDALGCLALELLLPAVKLVEHRMLGSLLEPVLLDVLTRLVHTELVLLDSELELGELVPSELAALRGFRLEFGQLVLHGLRSDLLLLQLLSVELLLRDRLLPRLEHGAVRDDRG